MSESQPNNSLHGKTLEAIVTELVARYGWAELGRRIPIRCFNSENGEIARGMTDVAVGSR